MLCLFAFSALQAQTVLEGNYEDLEKSETTEDLFKAALAFSLCQAGTDEYEYCMAEYEKLRHEIRRLAHDADSQAQLADAVLGKLYEKLLVQYSEKQSSLSETFLSGTYNCVTSSVLYLLAAKEAGIDVRGQRGPLHAFCSVYVDGKKIDVETTNPYGFNPGTKKPLESNGKGEHYTIVPKRYYSGRAEVSDRMLVSLIMRNLSADFTDRGNYYEAYLCARARLHYMEGQAQEKDSARDDFDMVVSNYAKFLNERDSRSGADFLCSVLDDYPATKRLQDSLEASVHNAVAVYVNSGNIVGARRCFDEYRDKLSEKRIRDINDILTVKETQLVMNEILSDESVKMEMRFLNAASYCDEVLKDNPGNASLKKMKASNLKNFEASVHNSFAACANEGKNDEALNILEEALKLYPESSVLKKDLAAIKKRIKK